MSERSMASCEKLAILVPRHNKSSLPKQKTGLNESSNRLKMMERVLSASNNTEAALFNDAIENQDIYRKNSALFVKSDDDINDRNFSDVEMESPNFNKETPIKAAMDHYSSPTVKMPKDPE